MYLNFQQSLVMTTCLKETSVKFTVMWSHDLFFHLQLFKCYKI